MKYVIDFDIMPRPELQKGKYGNMYYDPKYVANHRELQLILKSLCNKKNIKMTSEPVEITYAYFISRRDGDIDNCDKNFYDCLQGSFLKNDRQIVQRGKTSVHRKQEKPRIEFEIRVL
ncbi:MAG TPA: RusA family crossover junction endodeoxyribonuclease [Methanosarcinales archaeon]|nr:RusA family crossover junction endodeoxyribonuclease [Methanosarcinales archaeon]